MPTPTRWFSLDALTAAAVLVAGCTDAAPSAPDQGATTPVSLTITEPGVVRDGDVVQLAAVARDRAGKPVTARIDWSVVDSSVASVTANGVLTAHREGRTEVVAMIAAHPPGAHIEQRRPLAVVLHPATTIEVTRTSLELPLNTTGAVAVTLRGLDGRVLQGRPLTWESDDPATVRVDANGRLVPLQAGATTVRVRYGTLSAAVLVRVPAAVPAPITTTWDIVAVNGRAVPAIIEDNEITLPGGPAREIVRIEGSTVVTVGAAYSVNFSVVTIHRMEFMGNTGERVVARASVRDRGTVMYDWFTGDGLWTSTDVRGLTHQLLTIEGYPTVRFREPGSNTVWLLRLRER
ncbi:MAG: Ig-like domain-containing protein [Gemmatimonadaceae bacterium]|jgi:hypothetical protein|nr:Ig-like domain-containing protein [Gemmatimonadaceae bacterium]